MKEFNELWDFIIARSADQNMPIVQDKAELGYVFNLMKNCSSYLEVGTAEGNSLYVLANAMPEGSEITYVDWAEAHTEDKRNFILDRLSDYKITPVHADSNDLTTKDLASEFGDKKYDCVLIDAGHDDFNVSIDALLYGPLARKYIIFHDIKLPDVERAFNWYCKQRPECKNYRIINSETYGFGVIECTQ